MEEIDVNDLRTNAGRLVKISVMGEVDHPTVGNTLYRIALDGGLRIPVGGPGIVNKVRVGDPATGWEADHLEPCVSIRNNSGDRMTGANGVLNALSCVGNQDTVVTGKAEGATGVVTGQHGGAERLMAVFTPDILTRMLPSDKVLVTPSGVGIKLLNYPDVRLFNLDLEFLHRMNIL